MMTQATASFNAPEGSEAEYQETENRLMTMARETAPCVESGECTASVQTITTGMRDGSVPDFAL